MLGIEGTNSKLAIPTKTYDSGFSAAKDSMNRGYQDVKVTNVKDWAAIGKNQIILPILTDGSYIMKKSCLVTALWIALGSGTSLATDLADVLAKPDKYDDRHVELVGIARVPGYFYLFADLRAAAKTDLSKAVVVRRNNSTQPEYREFDRQWVRVSGVMSSKEGGGYDPEAGVLLEHVELLHDRRPPRIADATVQGVFKNGTSEPLAVELISRSNQGGVIFFLKPGDFEQVEVWEGRAVASQLKGPKNASLDMREIGKPIATGEITLKGLPTDYQYSPESSEKRRLYFRIIDNRIESVPASAAKN